MNSVIRWAIGLVLAPVLGYALLALYLVFRLRPLPIAAPWMIALNQPKATGTVGVLSLDASAGSRRRSKSLVKAAA